MPTPLLALLLFAGPLLDDPVPGAEWRQYASPADAGFSAAGLADARAQAEAADSAAVFVVRRGHVVVAWGDVDRRFKCHSVRKSLLSALYGIHVDEGHLDLAATLAELDVDDREGLTDDEREARVIDLLCARSGVYHPAAKEPRDMSANRPARGSHAPGTHWWYNNWDFNTLLPIFEAATGTRVFEEFERRLARPLGLQDFRLRDGFYQLEPSKSEHPAYAFRLSARDLARFGLLYLNEGRWNGESIVPAEWVRASTRSHSTHENGGYGYMWWTYPPGCLDPEWGLDALDELGSFAARGTGGQFVLVVPEADLVFVHRGDTDNDRPVAGGAIWRLAEAILDARVAEPRPDAELVAVEPIPFANPGPEPVERDAIDVAPELLDELAGTYAVAPGFEIVIHVYAGRLFARAPEGEVELFAETESRWFARGAPIVVDFERDDAGAVTAVRGTVEGRPLMARRL